MRKPSARRPYVESQSDGKQPHASTTSEGKDVAGNQAIGASSNATQQAAQKEDTSGSFDFFSVLESEEPGEAHADDDTAGKEADDQQKTEDPVEAAWKQWAESRSGSSIGPCTRAQMEKRGNVPVTVWKVKQRQQEEPSTSTTSRLSSQPPPPPNTTGPHLLSPIWSQQRATVRPYELVHFAALDPVNDDLSTSEVLGSSAGQVGTFERDAGQVGTLTENDWQWSSTYLERAVVEHDVRERLTRRARESSADTRVARRWMLYALLTTWRDEQLDLRVFPHQAAKWVGEPAGIKTQKELLAHLRTGGFENIDTLDAIPARRCTLIREDSIDSSVWTYVWRTLKQDPTKPVRAVSGKTYRASRGDASDIRREIAEEAAEAQPPSTTAKRIYSYLHSMSSRRFSQQYTTERVDEARKEILARDYAVTLTSDEKKLPLSQQETLQEQRRMELKAHYLRILRSIQHQPKPFYRPSRRKRTDRLFARNESALSLPKAARKALCKGLYEVDLVSAHLMVAAWLWGAEDVLKRLKNEDYHVWTDLIDYLYEGSEGNAPVFSSEVWGDLKGALKVALYSTVYGMQAQHLQRAFTRGTKDLLGIDSGKRLRSHPMIAGLLEARDEKLASMQIGEVVEGPTGVTTIIEQPVDSDADGVDARSAMATLAQSYEQELMSVVLDVAEKRPRMYVHLWIHDGAYVDLRYPRKSRKALQSALDEKARELTQKTGRKTVLPARFEVKQL